MAIQKYNETNLRSFCKMIQYIFKETAVKVEVYYKTDKGKQRRNSSGESEDKEEVSEAKEMDKNEEKGGTARRKKRNIDREIISVKPIKGKTFADTVKDLKRKVDINKIGVKINRISQTKGGNVRIEVASNDKIKSEELKKEITDKVDSGKITQGMITVFIKNIDETTTEQEVKQIVTNRAKCEEESLEVKMAKRANHEGLIYAVVTLPIKEGVELLKTGTIEAGWAKWRVEEKIIVTKCYKCLKFGHVSGVCKEQEMSEQPCYKCGRTGHRANTYENEPRCYVYGEDGHEAGKITCPEYRRVMAIERRKKRRGGSYNPEQQ